MDDRLKQLRKSLEKTTFKKLDFSPAHQHEVHKKIEQLQNEDDVMIFSILQLLKEEKTGYELTQQLHARGNKKIENNEGQVYTLLHELEQSQTIEAHWSQDGNKYYQLSSKGIKKLLKEEKAHRKKPSLHKQFVEGFQ